MKKDTRNPILTIETEEYILQIFDHEEHNLEPRNKTIVYM